MSKPPDSDSRPPLDVNVVWLRSIATWAILLVIILWFFDPFRFVFLGLLAAASLASALLPLRDKLPGPSGVRALVAGLLPAVALLLIFSTMSYFLTTGIQAEIAQWPETRQSINDLLAGISYRLHLDQPLTIDEMAQQFTWYLSGGGGKEIASATAGWVSKGLIGLAMLVFGTLYLLLSQREELLLPLKAMSPLRRRQITMAVADLQVRLRWWVIGTAIGMGTIGLITGVAYTLLGLKMAIPLAILAGITEMVPTLGPLFAFLVAVLFAATQGGGMMIAVGVTYIVIQAFESYALIPMVMKKAISMPPIVTLFTLVLWGRIFGPAGLLLALPINLTIVSFADRLLRRTD